MKKVCLLLSLLMISALAFAGEKSLYEFSWLDKDKEIYVLQNRKFRKVDKAYVGFNGVKTLSGAFVDSYGASVRGGYFFREDWGFEFAYGKNSGDKNDTAKGVEDQGSYAFFRKIDSYMSAMVTWAPFYSKINTFNKVFYYDWMFSAGLASMSTKDNRKEFDVPSNKTLTSESLIGASWNTGFRFYVTEAWSIRLDFTGLHAKPKKATVNGQELKTNSLFSSYDMGVGLNYTF